MSTLQFRPSVPDDVPRAMRVLEQDRALFTAATWARVPAVLTRLVVEQRCLSFVVEEIGRAGLRFFGLTGFVHPPSVTRVVETSGGAMRDGLVSLEVSGPPPFLSRRGVAHANARGQLALVHLFGCPDITALSDQQGQEIHRMAFDAFVFSHAGYRIAEFWQEAIVPGAAASVESTGAREVSRRDVGRQFPARLFRFTREDALANPGQPLAHLLKYPAARFGFTEPQQRLLELALLDISDRDAAHKLFVTDAAVKKRWRSIYERVRRVAPALTAEDASGADRRRQLLAYLRQHLEELRPTARRPRRATP